MTTTQTPDQKVANRVDQKPIRVDQKNTETAGKAIRHICKTAGREIRHRSDQKSDQKPIRPIRKNAKPQVEKSEKKSDKSDTQRSENRTPLYRRGAVCRRRPDRDTTAMTAHVLYRFHDAADRLLYIGITADPPARFRSHGATKRWWAEVAHVRLEHHTDRHALADAERAAILAERPRYNITHNRHRQFDAISAAMADAPTAPSLRFWIDVACPPWFGTCPGCDRELGNPAPETVAKLAVGDDQPYGGGQPWFCLPCLDQAMRAEIRLWASAKAAAR